MNQELLFRRYQEYQSYVGWTVTDEQHLRAAAEILLQRLEPLIDDFYAEIGRHPETRKVLDGSQTTVLQLKGALRQWLQDLLTGPYDAEYVARRWQVGRRHVEVGLEQVYVSTALARLRAELVTTLDRCWPTERDGLVPAILSLNKLLDLDLTILENAYQTEYLARVRRSEYLVKAGHVVGCVGHELRGPLNVLRTSAYFLRHARDPLPEKAAEHFQRIEKSMGAAGQILLELSDFARMSAPLERPFQVGSCVAEALERTPLPTTIRVEQDFPLSLPAAQGDGGQICKAFVCLIRHARDRMRDGGRLAVRGRQAGEAVAVVFKDTGLPMPQAQLAALALPLSRDSVRTLGMTLAVALTILDGNRCRFNARSEPGRGCTTTVTLATAPQATSEQSPSGRGSAPGDTSVC